MGKIWLSSDLHFGHSKPFLWEPRGYTSSREHDVEVIRNWNSVVALEDDVYILGDLMLEDTDYGIACVNQLNGRLHLIRGNHDSDIRWARYKEELLNVVELCGWAEMIKYHHTLFYLSHWPAQTGNYDDMPGLRGRVISLSGHTHKKEHFHNGDVLKYNIALDAHENYPVLLEDIVEDIKEKMFEII